MELKTFIAEIKADLATHAELGMIDETSLTRWVLSEITKFGEDIMTLQDTVVPIYKGKGTLPDNFYSLYIATKCDRLGYQVDEEDKKVVQNSMMWIERTERGQTWHKCCEYDPCDKCIEEKTITETVYVKQRKVDFHYTNPQFLKLGKRNDFSKCHSACRNAVIRDCPHTINIIGKRITTNFDKGDVYIQYYGLPKNEYGEFYIPEEDSGHLISYLEYHAKRKLTESLMVNNQGKNLASLFSYYIQEERRLRDYAETAIKMSNISPSSFKRITQRNRRVMKQHWDFYKNI